MKKQHSGYEVIKALHYETGVPVIIEINGGVISEIKETGFREEYGRRIFVAPGLIDNQINGYCGVDFSSDGVTVDNMRETVSSIWKDGVTTFLPTIITNSHENLLRNFRNITATLKDEAIRDSVAGFHLEGPYISPEEGYFGCHPSSFIRKPDWSEFLEYQEASEGNIIQVTLSPEVEGAMEFIAQCRRNNITVAIGHSNASAEQINQAVEMGARLSTHLGNGCANLINRHRNPIWPQLANDKLTPTVIADGHHLPPELLRVYFKVKGADNLILTSDVNHLIGMAPGVYNFLGSDVVLTPDGLVKNQLLNCLAGASMPLRAGVGNMIRFTGCTAGEAINMASVNPAAVNNLTDRAVIACDKRADLILFTADNDNIVIVETWVKGKKVFPV